jgi:hypothetical protein
MDQPIYRPIYYTWIALYVTLVLGIFVWILGGLFDLPWIWDEFYREWPSGLMLVFIVAVLVAITVFVGAFTNRKYLAAIVAALGGLITALILWAIGWILETWDTTTMIVIVIMLVFVVVGLVFLFFARLKVAIAAWFVLSAIICVWVLLWIESIWGTSFLYWLLVVVVVVLYVVVFLMHILLPKSFLEG